jgi:two-component system chemotaxis response regulator CheY
MPEIETVLLANPRRAPRHHFGGAIELTDLESGRTMVALVRTLSLYGCFVKTDKPLPMGGKFALTITDSGSHFSAIGRVASQANDGVGIEFTGISPIDQARLEDCLAELAATEPRTPGVLVVDDHSVTRNTIRSFLARHSFPICGEAENGKQAVEKVKELRPEVVLLDIEMPVMNGIQAAREIRRIAPSTKILFFTIHRNEALSGIRLRGAEGFVTKSAAGTELLPALKRMVKPKTERHFPERERIAGSDSLS